MHNLLSSLPVRNDQMPKPVASPSTTLPVRRNLRHESAEQKIIWHHFLFVESREIFQNIWPSKKHLEN